MTEQQDLANEIWDSAVDEFKNTLNNLTIVSPSSDVKLGDLIKEESKFKPEIDQTNKLGYVDTIRLRFA